MADDSDLKTHLRAEMKTLRDELSARDPDAGETLAARFPMKLLERYGPVVAGYIPLGSEIDPLPLMARIEAAGGQLCLPRTHGQGMMSFHEWRAGAPLETGPFGLKQPATGAPEARPTLLLIPLLAFDGQGNRLGYGKGYYDRALGELRSHDRAFACGLGFHGQMSEAVPSEAHDQPLDWAVTERGSVPLFMMRAFPDPGSA